jgi:glutamate/aspartate transport system substrate-binding protein
MTYLNRFITFPLVVASALAATVSFAGPTLDRIKQTGAVNIGYRATAVPFSFTSTDGKSAVGYSIEICDALVDSIEKELRVKNLRVNYVPVTSADRFGAIVDGKIDIECANTTNTKARRERVAFAMPHYFAAARLLVREGAGVNSMEDLAGKTLVVVKGSTGAQIADARKARMNVVVVDNDPAAVKMIEEKKADAYMTDDILLHGIKAQSKEKLAVVGPNMSVEPLAIMFHKNDAELNKLVEREMTTLYTTGKLRATYRKWFQSSIPQREFNLNTPPNILHSDMFSRPSGYTVDWVVL